MVQCAIIPFISFVKTCEYDIPDSKVHGAYMWPTWVLQDPGGSHVGPMNLAIWDAPIDLIHVPCDLYIDASVKLQYLMSVCNEDTAALH